jgi:hypothetical protein
MFEVFDLNEFRLKMVFFQITAHVVQEGAGSKKKLNKSNRR